MNFWGSLTHAGDKHDEEISNFSSPSQAGPSWRFCYEFNFASQSSYKSEALYFTVVLSVLFCWISCAITSLGVRWISSGFIASFSQVSAFNRFRSLPFVVACVFLAEASDACGYCISNVVPGWIKKLHGILTVECFVGSNQMSSGDQKLDAIPRLLLR